MSWFEASDQRWGSDIPSPQITNEKDIGRGRKLLSLSWSSGSGNIFQKSVFDLESTAEINESSCRTRKDLKQSYLRNTIGLHIAAYPCGVIADFAELFGSESIGQVHATIVDFIGDVPEEIRSEILGWLYDDMCHLKPYSEYAAISSQSKMSSIFANMKKAVDKMHFRGHRGGYCQQNCDPWKIPELGGVNTPVCEQTFAWLN